MYDIKLDPKTGKTSKRPLSRLYGRGQTTNVYGRTRTGKRISFRSRFRATT